MLFVISVGGSLIYPDSGLDHKFIKVFSGFLDKQLSLGHNFLLVTGGGKLARDYIAVAKKFKASRDQQDYLGISATRHNALLLKSTLGARVYPEIITDPNINLKWRQKIAIASGWRPGRSTDYVAVALAKTYQAKSVINLSNIDYVYDRDPKLPGAKKLKKLNWSQFRKIVGNKWRPGINAPFDPVASRLADNYGLEVVVLNGKNLKNLSLYLAGKEFKGTIIKD